jgi:hypothetical protein
MYDLTFGESGCFHRLIKVKVFPFLMCPKFWEGYIAARIPVLRGQVALEGHGNPGSVDVDAEHDGTFPVFPGFGAVDVENQAKGCFG